jgi:hypothetical protein
MKNQDIKTLFTPIFLQLHIAEDTQKDALDIFTHIIESQDETIDFG